MNAKPPVRCCIKSAIHIRPHLRFCRSHLQLQADGAAAMDIDSDTVPARDTAQAPAGPGSTETTPASTLPSSSDALLKSIGAAADNAERLDVRAPAAAASLAWQPQPDGNVTLTPAVAAMADADDPGEDDVDQLQVRGKKSGIKMHVLQIRGDKQKVRWQTAPDDSPDCQCAYLYCSQSAAVAGETASG